MAQQNSPPTAAFSTLYLSAPAVINLVRRKGVDACLRGIAD
ncbi:MAG: ornithine cyclodeaminase, partial [Comamonadaceae bacterium]